MTAEDAATLYRLREMLEAGEAEELFDERLPLGEADGPAHADKRTDGAPKRTDGAPKRTDGAPKRTDGAPKRRPAAKKKGAAK